MKNATRPYIWQWLTPPPPLTGAHREGQGASKLYCILPSIGAPLNRGALPIVWGTWYWDEGLNRPIFLNNWPISNPKPALESSEPQLLLHGIRSDLAIEPGVSIWQNTVHVGGLTSTSSCIFCFFQRYELAPTRQFWDSGGVKLESLCNFSIVGC